MATLISAEKWVFDPKKLGPNLSLNHGLSSEITTEKLLKSIEEIENRPEMQELDRLLMESNLYLQGKNNV